MYYFIVNPNSGCGNGLKVWNQTKKFLSGLGTEYDVYFTAKQGDAMAKSHEVSSAYEETAPEKPLTVIAMGGDGTINEVLNGLDLSRNVVFGFIPSGSGNDLCRSLGFPQAVQYGTDPAQHIFAIRVCKSNETRAVPFSKARADQVNTLSITNKNLRNVIKELIPDYKAKVRYKVTGQFDAENRTMYYDMSTAEECEFRGGRV